ncbi:replicative DNA helicase [Gallibacterium salpingitidis]|uniref:replicative DNA helicase n=1 Tax=Gallibacterium salpingitidis TaxID=505341 RepID=UPI00266EA4E6|nr:replicative DNA helicase [Gallibacterium salpingitidis]WKS98580.1 replicative DNA helicase [Gallibacterium salpingitidis]
MKKTDKLFDTKVEQAVIGALLINNDCYDSVAELLSPDHFYSYYNKIIFNAIQNRLSHGQSVDPLILEQDLKKTHLDQEGLFAYLIEMAQYTPSVANIKAYSERLQELSKLRNLLQLGKNLQQSILSNAQIETIIADAESKLFNIANNLSHQPTLTSLSNAMQIAINRIESVCQQNSAISGIPTGIEDIDVMTTGFQPSDFVVIAGRPGMGKTAFLLSSIKATLEQANMAAPIQFFSLEMPADQILMRLMSMVGNVSMQTLRNPLLLSNDDFSKLSLAMQHIKNWENRLLIDDSPALTPEILRSRVRRYARLHGQPAAIFIDYLQLMKIPGSANRYEEISRISNALKALAKEMHCPVITLSQLNRAVEGRAIKKPTNADLRDSGEIEQDADVIILLHRDDYYQKDKEPTGLAEIIIGKQRNGPVGSVTSYFAAQYSRFESYQDGASLN